MKKIDISFSQDRFDQWRLTQAGGYIHITPKGKTVFRFDNQAQYDLYMKLYSERGKLA